MAASMNSLVRRIICKKFVHISVSSGNAGYSYLPWSGLRCYHSSPSLCKKYNSIRKLEKMFIQKKKKYYYDPMNVAQLGKLATGVSGGKTKVQREDSIRLRTYNKILFDNLTYMMTTNLVSDELEELQVTVIGVKVSGDMSACRVFWMATGSVEEDDRIEEVLNRHKGPLRRALISHRVLGKIPPIFFMKDKESANISEVERLLAIADFGPKEELSEVSQLEEVKKPHPDGKMEFITKTKRTSTEDEGGITQPSLFGIDHAALNKMIRTKNKKLQFEGDDAPTGLEEDDASINEKFAQFRAFMKKKKQSKAERKQSTFYMGELDSYKSHRTRNRNNDLQDEERLDDDIDDDDSDDYDRIIDEYQKK